MLTDDFDYDDYVTAMENKLEGEKIDSFADRHPEEVEYAKHEDALDFSEIEDSLLDLDRED